MDGTRTHLIDSDWPLYESGEESGQMRTEVEEPSGSLERSRGMRVNSRGGQQNNGPLSGFCRPAVLAHRCGMREVG